MERSQFHVLKNTFYTLSKIPLFLLQDDYTILAQSDNFPHLHTSMFQSFLLFPKEDKEYSVSFTEHEIYILFQTRMTNKLHYVLMGPILFNVPKHISNLNFLNFFQYGCFSDEQSILKKLPHLDSQLYEYVQLIYGFCTEKQLTKDQFHDYFYRPRALKYGEYFFERISTNRENVQEYTIQYQNEIRMLEAIHSGNSAKARIYASKLAEGNIGMMSEDELRNGKYAILAGITLVSRTVIDAGVNLENAYALSDLYCRKVDSAYDVKRLMSIFYDVIMDYCRLVQANTYHHYPLWTRSCIEYIDQHLHTPITLEDLSDYLHLTPAYISVQFKKITQKSIKQYINEQRIHEAKFLLRTSDLSIQEIALTLSYGTQSYFTTVFKQLTGILPTAYRNKKNK